MRALPNCARCFRQILAPATSPDGDAAFAVVAEQGTPGSRLPKFHNNNAEQARERHREGEVLQRDQRPRDLRRRADEDREIRDRWHAESRAAIAALAEKLDKHATAVEMLRPAVAALEVSRSKLAAWASIGFAGVVVFGWIVEAIVKATVTWAWSHIH
jgi:hypothetical protein